MHKKTDIAMAKWEWHFDKLQHGLMLRLQFQTKKICRERLPRFALGSLGKRFMERWERSIH